MVEEHKAEETELPSPEKILADFDALVANDENFVKKIGQISEYSIEDKFLIE